MIETISLKKLCCGSKSTLTAEEKQQEIDWYLSGDSCQDISNKTGRPLASITKRLRKVGILRTLSASVAMARANGKMIQPKELPKSRGRGKAVPKDKRIPYELWKQMRQESIHG